MYGETRCKCISERHTVKTNTSGYFSRKKFEHFFLGKGYYISPFIRDPCYFRVITWVALHLHLQYNQMIASSFHKTPNSLSQLSCCSSWSRNDLHTMNWFCLFPSLLTTEGTRQFGNSTICVSVALSSLMWLKQYGRHRKNCYKKNHISLGYKKTNFTI